MQEVAEKLRELFDASEYTSWNKLRDAILLHLGSAFTPSHETIKQMHTPGGKAAKTPDPIVLGTICQLYGVPVESVSPEVAELLRVLKNRLGRSIDLGKSPRTCNHPYGSQDPLPFDEGSVIDLRDHIITPTHQNGPTALLVRAS